MGTKKNTSQIAPCNGVEMCGADGTDGASTGPQDWITVPNALVTTIQFLLKGSGSSDIEVDVEVCVSGGESTPVSLGVFDPSSSDQFLDIVNESWDRFRINILTQGVAGAGSQALLSSRA